MYYVSVRPVFGWTDAGLSSALPFRVERGPTSICSPAVCSLGRQAALSLAEWVLMVCRISEGISEIIGDRDHAAGPLRGGLSLDAV